MKLLLRTCLYFCACRFLCRSFVEQRKRTHTNHIDKKKLLVHRAIPMVLICCVLDDPVRWCASNSSILWVMSGTSGDQNKLPTRPPGLDVFEFVGIFHAAGPAMQTVISAWLLASKRN